MSPYSEDDIEIHWNITKKQQFFASVTYIIDTTCLLGIAFILCLLKVVAGNGF